MPGRQHYAGKEKAGMRKQIRILGTIFAVTGLLAGNVAGTAAETVFAEKGETVLTEGTGITDTEKASAKTAGQTSMAAEEREENTDRPDQTITIYLDRKNQVSVRMAVTMYERNRAASSEGEYPAITWNLVDKSALSPEQYQAELWEELQNGGGPDVIFVDGDSVADPYLLMYGGYLADIGEAVRQRVEKEKLEFYPGTLEAGAIDDSQYLLPLSIQTPLLFSANECLEESGFLPQNGETLDGLMEWAANYQTESGKRAFDENTIPGQLILCSGLSFFDYESGTVQIQEEELKRLYDVYAAMQEAGIQKEEQGELDEAYQKIGSQESLFSLAGIGDIARMVGNLRALYGAGYELGFQQIPTMQGEIQTVITHAVGVNRNSEHKELAAAAAAAFLDFHTMSERQEGQGIPTVSNGSFWEMELSYTTMASMMDYFYWPDSCAVAALAADPFSGKDNLQDAYIQLAGEELEKAVFATALTREGGIVEKIFGDSLSRMQGFESCIQTLKEKLEGYPETGGCQNSGEFEENTSKVLNVWCENNGGMGEYHPVHQWLTDTVDGIDGIHVNVFGGTTSTYFQWMSDIGIAPDIFVGDERDLRCTDNLYGFVLNGDRATFASLSGLVEEQEEYYTGAWKAASLDESLMGVPYAAEVGGLWYNREVLKEAGLSGELEAGNWEELAEKLAEINSAVPEVIPILIEKRADIVYGILKNAGAQIYDAEEETIVVEPEVYRKAIEWLTGLGGRQLVNMAEADEAAELLKNGEAAVYLGYNTFLKKYRADGSLTWDGYEEKLGFLPFPALEDGQMNFNMMWEEIFFLSRGSANQKEALALIETCLNSDAYEQAVDDMYMVPVRKQEEVENPLVQSAAEALEHAGARLSIYPYDALLTLLSQAVRAEKEPEEIYELYLKVLGREVGEYMIEENK